MKDKFKILEQWNECKERLDFYKNQEMELRKEAIELFFNPQEMEEGTRNEDLENGYKLKAVFKISRAFGKKTNEEIEKVLQKIEKSGPEGEFLAERIVKWKPELSTTEYKNLDAKYLKIINEIVVSKPASPSLELVEPKVKK